MRGAFDEAACIGQKDRGEGLLMTDILGIDVGKTYLQLVLLQGEKIGRKKIENDVAGFEQLDAWLRNRKAKAVHACLEATGGYGERVAEHLYDGGHAVSIVNPIQIKAFGRSSLVRTKSDAIDAELIARFCQAHQPPAWSPPPREIRDLRAFIRRREALTEMATAEKNRLESTASDTLRTDIREHLAFLAEQLRKLESEIADHIDLHPGLRETIDKLDEIPGFGEITAIKLVAETNGFSVCDTARQLVAYAGLNPRHYQSGAVHRHMGISKIGNAAVRKALFYAAVSAKNRSHYFRPFVQRLEAAGKKPKVIITAIMRKLLVLALAVAKGQRFNPTLAA